MILVDQHRMLLSQHRLLVVQHTILMDQHKIKTQLWWINAGSKVKNKVGGTPKGLQSQLTWLFNFHPARAITHVQSLCHVMFLFARNACKSQVVCKYVCQKLHQQVTGNSTEIEKKVFWKLSKKQSIVVTSVS